MMELFVLLWTLELGAVFATGPAAVRWLAAWRARRDLPRARARLLLHS